MPAATNELSQVADRRLGRLPATSTRRALMFSDFVKFLKLPASQTYWSKRVAIPLRSYGNNEYGCCTRASQAVAQTRMERLEQRKTINVSDAEVVRVYLEMTARLYGGGDTGAYETDALDCWRDAEQTFRDDKGNPMLIQAYLRLNPSNHDEIKAALALSGAKGIKFCLNLPLAFRGVEPPKKWHVPVGQPLTGAWMPGSWGGHSLWMHGYTTEGVTTDHTWNIQPQIITWEALAAYCDEAHVVIDSLDAWRRQTKGSSAAKLNLADVRDAVNAVSSIRI